MTAETPGTPLTPEEEAAIRRDLRPDDQYQYGGWANVVGRLLATLDRERRERVDPDLLDEAIRKAAEGIAETGDGGWSELPSGAAVAAEYARLAPGERVDPDLRARIEALPRYSTRSFSNGGGMGQDFSGNGLWVSIRDVLAILAATEEPRFETFDAADGHKGIRVAATPDHTEGGQEPDAPCSFKGPWGECRRWRNDPVHVRPNEKKGREQHVWRNDRRATPRPR